MFLCGCGGLGTPERFYTGVIGVRQVPFVEPIWKKFTKKADRKALLSCASRRERAGQLRAQPPLIRHLFFIISFYFFFYDAAVYRVEVDLNLFAPFVGPVNFITTPWLFELPDFVAKVFGLLFERFFRHPFVLGLVGAILFSKSRDAGQGDQGCENKVFH